MSNVTPFADPLHLAVENETGVLLPVRFNSQADRDFALAVIDKLERVCLDFKRQRPSATLLRAASELFDIDFSYDPEWSGRSVTVTR
jgi:hypothetical protein